MIVAGFRGGIRAVPGAYCNHEKKATGYKTPQAGRDHLGANYTVWVRLPGDKKWYSPKDVSGIPRKPTTHEHLRVLKRDTKGKVLVRWLK